MNMIQILLAINLVLFFLEVINLSVYKSKKVISYEDDPFITLILYTFGRVFTVMHVCLNLMLFWAAFTASATSQSIYFLSFSMMIFNGVSMVFYLKGRGLGRYCITGIGILLWMLILILKIKE